MSPLAEQIYQTLPLGTIDSKEALFHAYWREARQLDCNTCTIDLFHDAWQEVKDHFRTHFPLLPQWSGSADEPPHDWLAQGF